MTRPAPFRAGHMRHFQFNPQQTFPGEEVHPVERNGLESDEHVVRPGYWRGEVANFNLTAMLAEIGCFQRLFLMGARFRSR